MKKEGITSSTEFKDKGNNFLSLVIYLANIEQVSSPPNPESLVSSYVDRLESVIWTKFAEKSQILKYNKKSEDTLWTNIASPMWLETLS